MRRRLLVSYLSLTVFVLLVLEIPLGVSYANSVERRLTSDLQHDAFSLAIRSQEPLDRADAAAGAAETRALQALADRYHSNAGGRVVITDAHGRSVADSDTSIAIGRDFSTRPEVRQALAGAEVSGTRSSATLGTSRKSVLTPSSAARKGSISPRSPATAVTPAGRSALLGERVSARTSAPLPLS